MLAVLVGCSEPVVPDSATPAPEVVQAQQTDAFIRAFALEAPARAVRAAEARVRLPSLAERFPDGLTFETDAAVRAVLVEGYGARAYSPLFVDGARLTPAGEALWNRLQAVDDHGLRPERYWISDIQTRLQALTTGADLDAIRARLELSEADQATLTAWLTTQVGADGTLPAVDAVFTVLSQPGANNPLPAFAATIDELARTIEGVATNAPEVELYLASALMRLSADLHFANFNGILPADAEARGWDLESEAGRADVLRQRLTTGFAEAAAATDLGAWIDAQEPQLEQYDRLVAGAREYQAYVEAGGWQPLPAEALGLENGNSGELVVALRTRLAAENYLTGDTTSPTFDAGLQAALETYQSTHQLDTSGSISEETLQSLNVPADRRLAQIYVTLDRWRQSRLSRHAGGEYIWASVPDFHAELWDNGERVYRWKVITGRPRTFRDGRVEGRTPLFSDTMLYVVFNPYWNVPREIRDDEYQHLIDADPMWLVNNGFEIVYGDNGDEILRQLPGPGNALGIVKFLFPNEHDVYMHDTPTRNLFSRPVRAFSHGCVRVHEPLELAEVILSRDRDWSEARTEDFIEEQLREGTEKWVNLARPLPVHIDYYTVRGDDDGRMNFLADIYRYDRANVNARQLEINPSATLPE